MKTIQLQTQEQVDAFIAKANLLLGYPNLENGTLTYTDVPEITEITETDENEVVTVIDSFYEIEITHELNEAMLVIEVNQMI